MHKKAILALIVYTLLLACSIAYAATTVEKHVEAEGWTLGNVLFVFAIIFGLISSLIGYIFTMTVKNIHANQRLDREDRKDRNEKLDNTLKLIFTELNGKRNIADCNREMDKHDEAIKEVSS